MSPEERELLNKSVSLAEENHRMLRSMRRSMHISSIISILYWVIIIGSAVGAYYLIQPYVDQIGKIYGEAKNNLSSFNQMFQSVKK